VSSTYLSRVMTGRRRSSGPLPSPWNEQFPGEYRAAWMLRMRYLGRLGPRGDVASIGWPGCTTSLVDLVNPRKSRGVAQFAAVACGT
jgi:hypothetical protein